MRATVEQLIERGRQPKATEHEKWVAWNLLNNTAFRARWTRKLGRGRL